MEPMVFYVLGTICSIVMAGGGIFAFWTSLTARITSNKMTAESAKALADHAHARLDVLIEEFSKQREATARNIGKLEATNDSLALAMREMTASLHHVVERLDRLVDGMARIEHGGS